MQNPYQYTAPVADRRYFFGRASVVSRIYSRIGADRPQSVSIVGDPKIGKTSLIWYLLHKESRNQFLDCPDDYFYFYMPLKTDLPMTFESFSEALCYILLEKLPGMVTGESITLSYDLFKKIVERLHNHNKKVIFFFDDFHLITQNESFPLEFFSFLRSLANNYNLAFITTSHLELQKLCVSKEVEESPFFNIFSNVTLKPLETAEAMQLIEIPSAEQGIALAPDANRILEFAGHFPFSLQAACRILFELKIRQPELDVAAWQEFEEEYYLRMKPYYRDIWDSFHADQREIICQIVKRHKIDRSKQFIIDELCRKNYLRNMNNQPELFSPVFFRFVAEHNHLPASSNRNNSRLARFIQWMKAAIGIGYQTT